MIFLQDFSLVFAAVGIFSFHFAYLLFDYWRCKSVSFSHSTSSASSTLNAPNNCWWILDEKKVKSIDSFDSLISHVGPVHPVEQEHTKSLTDGVGGVLIAAKMTLLASVVLGRFTGLPIELMPRMPRITTAVVCSRIASGSLRVSRSALTIVSCGWGKNRIRNWVPFSTPTALHQLEAIKANDVRNVVTPSRHFSLAKNGQLKSQEKR